MLVDIGDEGDRKTRQTHQHVGSTQVEDEDVLDGLQLAVLHCEVSASYTVSRSGEETEKYRSTRFKGFLRISRFLRYSNFFIQNH